MTTDIDKLAEAVTTLAKLQAIQMLQKLPYCHCGGPATCEWAGAPLCDAHLPPTAWRPDVKVPSYAAFVRQLVAFVGDSFPLRIR